MEREGGHSSYSKRTVLSQDNPCARNERLSRVQEAGYTEEQGLHIKSEIYLEARPMLSVENQEEDLIFNMRGGRQPFQSYTGCMSKEGGVL